MKTEKTLTQILNAVKIGIVAALPLLPGCASSGAKTPAQQITITDTNGLPPNRGYISAGGTVGKTLHTASVQGAVNLTHDTPASNVPVLIEANLGLSAKTGKNDSLYGTEVVKARAGYDTENQLSEGAVRLTILPEVSYNRRHRLSGDSEILRESAFGAGGSATLSTKLGDGWLRLSAGARKFIDAGNGELDMKDSYGKRLSLELSGFQTGGNALYALPVWETKGLLFGAGATYDDFSRKATGNAPIGRVSVVQGQKTLIVPAELGVYRSGKDGDALGFGSLSLTGGYVRTDQDMKRSFGSGASKREETGYIGIKGLQQILDRIYLGAELRGYPKNKEVQGSGSITVGF